MAVLADRRETILILGGTAEAAAIARRLVAAGADVVTSLAGRTSKPAPLPGRIRIGGFGGAEGLARYIAENDITRVIDATHPFANRISQNARLACAAAGIPLERPERPAWEKQPGDNWIEVKSLGDAAAALPSGARVFLALGRQHLAVFESRPDCHFVVRMVDPPEKPLGLAGYDLILGKPSADPHEEADLFRVHQITHLVCRNSGGEAGYGKIAAARSMGLPVVMVGRAA